MLFRGAGTALVTPFDESGEVNYQAFENLLDYQLENSIDALIVAGTTGESPVLSEDEIKRLTEIALDKANGQTPVIVGTGSNNTGEAIKKSKLMSDMGVDGLLVVTPYYNKATEEGLFQHYKAISDAVKVPIILYTVPGRTGMGISLDSLARLVELENVRALKDATGSLSYAGHVKKLVPDDFLLYSGNDDLTVPYLSLGADGVISVASNILPKMIHEMCYEYIHGDHKKASQMQVDLSDLMRDLFRETSPAPIKAALDMLGLEGGKLRLPLTGASQETKDLLRKDLEELGVL